MIKFARLMAVAALAHFVQPVLSQLTLPPSGDNQKSSVTQFIGSVAKVTIDYGSPGVRQREGKIWGQLVPWGLAPNNFGSAKEMPWRAGANENTTFEFSHDVLIQGKPLAAGKYVVTGDRETTTVLTVHPKDKNGNQRWELADGATLNDVTHLGCRSAR